MTQITVHCVVTLCTEVYALVQSLYTCTHLQSRLEYFTHSDSDSGEDKILETVQFQEEPLCRRLLQICVIYHICGHESPTCCLKGQTNEIFDLKFVSSFKPTLATDQRVKIFLIWPRF